MTTPIVSIVMPAYNAAATLDETIASVLNQTMQAFELIVVDDGSTDDSFSRLMAHSARDARIRLIGQKNSGASSARNLGVEMSKAQYIAFIDADDIWAPDKLARHLALHEARPVAAASYARIGFLPQNARSLAHCRTLSNLQLAPLTLLDVLGENPVCTMSNLFVAREWFVRVGGLDPALTHAEDQDFLARLLARGAHIEAINALLVGYRFSPDGLSMDLDQMKAGWKKVAQQHLDGPALAALEALYARYLARRTLRSGGPAFKAFSYAMSGLRTDGRSFLEDRRRGLGTLAGVFLAPFLPRAVRQRIFV